jgi:hypothetical protein
MYIISPRLARKNICGMKVAVSMWRCHKIKLFDWLAEILANQRALVCDVRTAAVIPHSLKNRIKTTYFLTSGIPQGKLIKRQQLPKDDLGNTWHWKDLNLAINVTLYGKVIRICNCDEWTKVCGSLNYLNNTCLP